MTRFSRNAALLLSLSLPFLAAHAGADPAVPSHDYWGVHGGQNDLDRLGVHARYASSTRYDGHVDLQHGAHVGVQLGRSSAQARYEVEFETGDFSARHLTAGPINADVHGRGHYQAAFANVYGTAHLSERLDAFAGIGAGWGHVEVPHLVLKNACTCFGKSTKDGGAWQARVGLAWQVSPASDVDLQYTRLGLPGAETDGPPAVQYNRLGFGAWTLGWRSRF